MVSTTRIDLQLEYPSAVVSVGILNPIQRARSMHHLQFRLSKLKKTIKLTSSMQLSEIKVSLVLMRV